MNNKAIDRIVERQAMANARVLKKIGEILGEIGELTPSEAYTIAKQLKYGESLKQIVRTLSKYSRLNEIDIYNLLEAEAKNNLELKKVYYKAKKVDFVPYKNNLPLKNLVKQVAMTTLNTYRNISATTGLTFLDRFGNTVTKPMEQAYWEIIDDAIMNVNMGKESFESALQKQLETIGEAGIQSIEYQSGYHRRIDSALRMNLQTGVTELFEKEQELLGNQFGFDGWEITVHENPAEDHEEVQGHQFTNEEYISLQNFGIAKDVNGRLIDIHNKYGGFRPIGELNCYHDAITIVIGVSKPKYTQEELDQIIERNDKGFEFEGKHYTMYEGTQLQRKIETEIRKEKEYQVMTRASNYQEMLEDSQRYIDKLTNKYYELSKASGLPTKLERIKVNGYKPIKSSAIKPIGKGKVGQLSAPKSLIRSKTKSLQEWESHFKEKYGISDFKTAGGFENKLHLAKNLDEMDKELLNDNLTQIEYLYDKYKLNDKGLRVLLDESADDYVALARGETNIAFSKETKATKEKIIEKTKDNIEHNWWTKVKDGNESVYAVTHEMGHIIENRITYPMLSKISLKEKGIIDQNIKELLMINVSNKTGLSFEQIQQKYFSGYAKSRKSFEWFAESFVQLELGQRNEWIEEFEKWLKQNY